MQAENFRTGTQFKNINTNNTWKVVNIDDELIFENQDYGDRSYSLDEDLFEEIGQE